MTNLPVPSPASVSPGNFITAALWNGNVRDGLNFLLNPPIFAGYQATGQSIPSGQTAVAITMDSETLDTYGGHSTTTNTSRYVAQVAGTYLVWGGFAGGGFASQTVFLAYVAKNGTEVTGSRVSDVGNASHSYALATVPVLVPMVANDYVELYGASDTAGTSHTGAPTSTLNVQWVHA